MKMPGIKRRIAAATLLVCVSVMLAPRPAWSMVMGQNFWFMSDWTSNFITKDLTICISRPFHTLAVGDDRDYPHNMDPAKTIITASALELDEDQYPLEIPSKGIRAVAKLYMTNLGRYGIKIPTGTYTLIFEGTGEVRVALGRSETDMVFTGTGGETRKEFAVTKLNPSGGTHEPYLNLRITRSQRGDHIRRIRLIQPDANGGTSYADNYKVDPWNPLFLNDVRPFKVMRWMEPGNTNTTLMSKWSERASRNCANQGGAAGFSFELQIELANRMNSDLWICAPLRVDDDFMDSLAKLVYQQLKRDRKVYIEYGNEIWLGKGAIMGTGDWPSTLKRQAERSARLFKAFEDAFGAESNRVINVIAGQAASSGVASGALSNLQGNPYGVKAEAVAIAPYLYGIDAGTLRSGIGTSIGYATSHKAIADKAGCELVCYEGGQHIVTGSFSKGTNYGPDIYGIYTDYLKGLAPSISVFVHFTIYGWCEAANCWGASLQPGQPLSEAPKAKALWDYAEGTGQLAEIPQVSIFPGAGPLPSAGRLTSPDALHCRVDNGRICVDNLAPGTEVTVFGLQGRRVFQPGPRAGSTAITESLPSGRYIVAVSTKIDVLGTAEVMVP